MFLKGRRRGIGGGNEKKWKNHWPVVIMMMEFHQLLGIMLETRH